MENNNGNIRQRSSYLENFDRYMVQPRGEKEISWIADQLIEWAHLDTSVTMLSFSGEFMVPQQTLYEWESKHPRIRESMRIARSLVGARREKLALENKFNAGIVNRTLGIYDERVRAYDREMKLISSQGEDKVQTINIMMQQMPNTDAVPKKKGKKKDDKSS